MFRTSLTTAAMAMSHNTTLVRRKRSSWFLKYSFVTITAKTAQTITITAYHTVQRIVATAVLSRPLLQLILCNRFG
jgi:hypothetical protein